MITEDFIEWYLICESDSMREWDVASRFQEICVCILPHYDKTSENFYWKTLWLGNASILFPKLFFSSKWLSG